MSAATVSSDKLSKPFSLSFGSRSKPVASKVNAKKRNYATLAADDSGEDEEVHAGKVQAVHSFDQAAGGAVTFTAKEEKGPLVIGAQKNLNWRDEARRRRGGANILPAEEQARRAGDNATSTDVTEQQPVYGLLTADKRQVDPDIQMEDVKIEVKPKTEDEEALDALLGKKESTLIIEQTEQGDTVLQTRTNDAQAFRADIAARPDSASLADYEAVPIEEFGLALLRGQGYKPGDPIGRRKNAAPIIPRVPQRRANLLGIGAKEVPEGLEEMGAWGKGAKKKGSKIDRSYNPLVLRNRETGEVLSQAELDARKEQQSLVLDTIPDKRSRRHRDYDEEKYESSRQSSSRRDRSRSKERRRRDYDRDERDREGRRSLRDHDDRRHRKADRGDYERSEKESRKTRHENDSSRRERRRDEDRERSYKDSDRERSYKDKWRHDR